MSAPASATVDLEVRYAETDQMGVVHHANYVVWFEVARTHLCSKSGIHYADIERRGYLLLVTGVEISYRRPARYGDVVRVTCRVARLGSRGVHFAYQVEGPAGLLATGLTQHVWVHSETRRPCRLPAEIQVPFEELAGRAAG
jgi:acyl-CoA thioester hydrolase